MTNQPIIAVVKELQGAATIKDNNGTTRALQIGNNVYLGESLQTANNAFVTLKYDDTRLTQIIGPNALFLADSSVFAVVLAEQNKEIGPDTATALLAENVKPYLNPDFIPTPHDNGLENVLPVDHSGLETQAHMGYSAAALSVDHAYHPTLESVSPVSSTPSHAAVTPVEGVRVAETTVHTLANDPPTANHSTLDTHDEALVKESSGTATPATHADHPVTAGDTGVNPSEMGTASTEHNNSQMSAASTENNNSQMSAASTENDNSQVSATSTDDNSQMSATSTDDNSQMSATSTDDNSQMSATSTDDNSQMSATSTDDNSQMSATSTDDNSQMSATSTDDNSQMSATSTDDNSQVSATSTDDNSQVSATSTDDNSQVSAASTDDNSQVSAASTENGTVAGGTVTGDMINYSDASSGVTISLFNQDSLITAAGGGNLGDSIKNINSPAADTLTSSENANVLVSSSNDTLTADTGTGSFAPTTSTGDITILDYSSVGGQMDTIDLKSLFTAPATTATTSNIVGVTTDVLQVSQTSTGASGDFAQTAIVAPVHGATDTLTVVLDQSHNVVV